ncbi:hypothetical protein BDV36DRAFT_255769 [Aspergillus pseudocaelatus]|uniref:Uncharacterized protein n=1 Tax=Aspergillus pseudocaelatus TaxID=1825620 RepID=A0ABQ6WKW0_9EURO|nr:hypothetical protein BDV36DRAFT_255769 [Aspergillus pseudocaelatus]
MLSPATASPRVRLLSTSNFCFLHFVLVCLAHFPSSGSFFDFSLSLSRFYFYFYFDFAFKISLS